MAIGRAARDRSKPLYQSIQFSPGFLDRGPQSSCDTWHMRRRIPSLSSLRAFEAAARMRSFKQAADEPAVTASAVSHRIRALEEEIGRRLFARKTRAVELTPEGRSLYSAVRDGFDTIASGVEKVRQRARPLVKLSTHAGGCEGGRLVSSHADSFRLGATVPVDLTWAAWARSAAARSEHGRRNSLLRREPRHSYWSLGWSRYSTAWRITSCARSALNLIVPRRSSKRG